MFSLLMAIMIFTWFKLFQQAFKEDTAGSNHQIGNPPSNQRSQFWNEVDSQKTSQLIRPEYAGPNSAISPTIDNPERVSALWRRKQQVVSPETQQRWSDLASEGQWSELAREQRLEFNDKP